MILEFLGFQNFKKFHYWVRHAKCTWSSCNICTFASGWPLWVRDPSAGSKNLSVLPLVTWPWIGEPRKINMGQIFVNQMNMKFSSINESAPFWVCHPFLVIILVTKIRSYFPQGLSPRQNWRSHYLVAPQSGALEEVLTEICPYPYPSIHPSA